MENGETILSGKGIVDRRYARGDKVYDRMLEEVEKDGSKCPLCTLAVHKNPILSEIDGWFITERYPLNPSPEHHLMIIPRRHISKYHEMTASDDSAVRSLVAWAINEYDIKGAGLALRFGDSGLTGSSVPGHLHYHLIVPRMDPATHQVEEVIYFPIG